jgi:hypothetical protein
VALEVPVHHANVGRGRQAGGYLMYDKQDVGRLERSISGGSGCAGAAGGS